MDWAGAFRWHIRRRIAVGLAAVSPGLATHALREIVAGSGLGSFGGDIVGLAIWAAIALAAAGRVVRWDD